MHRCSPRLIFVPLACALALPAQAAVVIEDEADHAAALAAQPSFGVPFQLGFEELGLGAALQFQYVDQGLEFDGGVGPFILPEAFGTSGIGSRLAVAGFDPLEASSLTLLFEEPQRVLSLRLVDVEGTLVVDAWRDGALVETFTVTTSELPVDGGAFRAIWFATFVDEVTFSSGLAEDGFGIDELAIAELGSVDNDGDGVPESEGDCDDDDPTVFPADLCGGIDLDCDGDADDVDGDGSTPCEGDCDDGDADVFSGATEACNGVDDDCDGLIDESADSDGDGFTLCEGDCDDGDSAVFPGVGDCDPVPPGDDDDDDDDDDTTGSGDDDDTSGSDDDDTTGPGDDDDTTGSGDDDDTSGTDDDDTSGSDDDDTSGSDDDDDDTSGSGDDDDDDDTGDDDDGTSGAPPGFPDLGLAGGGCACSSSGPSSDEAPLALLLVVLLRRRRRLR